MGGIDFSQEALALFICSFTLGGIAIVALTIRRPIVQIGLTALFTFSGVSLFNSASKWTIVDIPGGNWVSFAAAALVFLAFARYFFAKQEPLREKLRHILIPHLWDPKNAEPSSMDDLCKRWFVTVAGATGCLVGVVIADTKTWDTIWAAFSSQLFFTLFLTVVSFTLIGPGEEFVMGATFRSANPGDEDEEPRSHFEELFRNFSLSALGRFLLVGFAWLTLTIVHKCVDETLSSGQFTASTELLMACVPTAVVTYYWCAALQRGVPNVSRTSFRAVTAAMSLLFVFYFVFAIADAIFLGVKGMGAELAASPSLLSEAEKYVGLGTTLLGIFAFAIALLLAVAATVIFCGAIFGVISYLGGLILDVDKSRPERASFLTIARLVPLIMIWHGLLLLVASAGTGHLYPKDWHWDYTTFFVLLADVIWGLGLLVSGFPKIVEHARRQSPQIAARVSL